MAKQDDWARITLRLPPSLHAMLQAAAETSSLNAEIIDRLELTFQRDQAILIPPARVTIDMGGRPTTWADVQRVVAAIVAAFPDPITTLSIDVLTPEIIADNEAREADFNAWAIGNWSASRTYGVDLPDEDGELPSDEERKALARLDQILKERAPADLSLNRLIERVIAGEDPEKAFEDELAAFNLKRNRPTTTHPPRGRPPTAEEERLEREVSSLLKRAPKGMEVRSWFARVDAGEDPTASFEDELAAYNAGRLASVGGTDDHAASAPSGGSKSRKRT